MLQVAHVAHSTGIFGTSKWGREQYNGASITLKINTKISLLMKTLKTGHSS